MHITIEDKPIKLRIAIQILSVLATSSAWSISAGKLREIGLLDGQAKPSERDAVMEALRNTYAMEPYGGSGRGRSYRITRYGMDLLSSYLRVTTKT